MDKAIKMYCSRCGEELKIGEKYFSDEDYKGNSVAICITCYAKMWGMGNLFEVGKDYDLVFNKNLKEGVKNG